MVESAAFDWMVIFWGIIGIIVVVSAYKIAKFWLLAKSDTKAALRAQLEDYKHLADHHKKEAQRWRGRYGNLQVKPTVEGNPEDPETFIPQLIEQFGHLAPEWLKKTGVLHNKGAINFLIQQAKEHPDAVQSILAQFVAKPSDAKNSQETAIDEGQFA